MTHNTRTWTGFSNLDSTSDPTEHFGILARNEHQLLDQRSRADAGSLNANTSEHKLYPVIARYVRAAVEEIVTNQHELTRHSIANIAGSFEQRVDQVENLCLTKARIAEAGAPVTCNASMYFPEEKTKENRDGAVDLPTKLLMQSLTEQLEQHQRRTENFLAEHLNTDHLYAIIQGVSVDRITEKLGATIAKYIDTSLSEHFAKQASKQDDDGAASSDLNADRPSARFVNYIDTSFTNHAGKHLADGAVGREHGAARNATDASALPPEDDTLSAFPSDTVLADAAQPDNASPECFATPFERVKNDFERKTVVLDLAAAVGWETSIFDNEVALKSRLVPFRQVHRLIHGRAFSTVVTVAVILNAILIGYQANGAVERANENYQSRINNQPDGGLTEPNWIKVMDLSFTVFFTIELLLRMAVEDVAFFNGIEWQWNIFDIILVATALLEEFFKGYENLSFMRLLRILRACRAIRVLRMVRWLRDLRVMLISVMSSFLLLLYALFFLFFVKFLFAVLFIHGISNYLDMHDPDEPEFDKRGHSVPDQLIFFFGSMQQTLLSLFACITGGADWLEVHTSLSSMSPFYGYLFIVYVSFMLIGVLNVIVGIFVDGANDSSQKERAMINQHELQMKGSHISDLKDMLIAQVEGTERSGIITEAQLELVLSTPQVVHCFENLGIDRTEAIGMLRLLSGPGEDGQHSISIDEFIVGLLLLKEHESKAVVTFWYESKQMSSKLYQLLHFTNEHFMYQESCLQRQSVFNSRMQKSIDALQVQVDVLTGDRLPKEPL